MWSHLKSWVLGFGGFQQPWKLLLIEIPTLHLELETKISKAGKTFYTSTSWLGNVRSLNARPIGRLELKVWESAQFCPVLLICDSFSFQDWGTNMFEKNITKLETLGAESISGKSGAFPPMQNSQLIFWILTSTIKTQQCDIIYGQTSLWKRAAASIRLHNFPNGSSQKIENCKIEKSP